MITANIVNIPDFKSTAITPLARTLQADTNLVAFNIRVSPGAVVPRGGLPIKLFFATSSFAVSAGSAPAQFSRQAQAVEIPVPWKGGVPACHQSIPELILGPNLYVWTSEPALDVPVSLEVDVVEV